MTQSDITGPGSTPPDTDAPDLSDPDFSGPDFSGPDRGSPERLLLSFAADYKLWNDTFAALLRDRTARRSIGDAPETSYQRWTAPYLAGGVRLQGVSYGSRSTFDPAQITITATEPLDGGVALHFAVPARFGTEPDRYVAEIETAAAGPLLRQIWYVDPFPAPGGETRLPML